MKDYESADVEINRYKLEEVCSQNPSQVQYFNELLAEAKIARDELYYLIKRTIAEVELEHRRNPPKDVKMTDSTVTALTESDKKVIAARNAWVNANEDVYFYEAQVTALDDKRAELKNLVSLWIGGYYSNPGSSPSNEMISTDIRRKLSSKED